MNDFSVRITRRTELGDRSHEESVDIDFGEIMPPALVVEGFATAAAVANATGLQAVNLTPSLEWSPTLCDGERVNYAAAEKACAALGEGWRLPTRMELESILDLTRHDPAVDTARFPGTKSGWYWSSTPCAWSSGGAWVVSFGYGHANDYHRDLSYAFVRAVRSLPAGQ